VVPFGAGSGMNRCRADPFQTIQTSRRLHRVFHLEDIDELEHPIDGRDVELPDELVAAGISPVVVLGEKALQSAGPLLPVGASYLDGEQPLDEMKIRSFPMLLH